MIEKYIEKDLFRQLVLCERFHRYSYISIDELSELLDVFPKTIENDIKKLEQTLHEFIAFKERNRKNYYLVFSSTVSLYELRTLLYRQSLFLRVCQMMVDGKGEYLEITESYFVSVSKAYNLIHQVEDFFKEMDLDYRQKTLHCSELLRRLLMLCLNLDLNERPLVPFPIEFERACDAYIDEVTAKYPQLQYSANGMKRVYLKHGLFLSYARQHICTAHDEGFQEIIEPLPFYQNLYSIWQESELQNFLQEAEFFFVFYLFHSLNYGYKEIIAILEDESVLDELINHQYAEFADLAQRLADHLGNSDGLKDRAFKQAFIRLIRTSYANHQLLLPHPICVVEPEIREFSEGIFQVVEKWGAEQVPKQQLDQSLIHRFVDEYARIHYHSKKLIKVLLVTDSPIKFIVYRDFLLDSWLQLDLVDYRYDSLEEALEAAASTSLILCESTLFYYQESKKSTGIVVVPIDLASIRKPIFGEIFYSEIVKSLWG